MFQLESFDFPLLCCVHVHNIQTVYSLLLLLLFFSTNSRLSGCILIYLIALLSFFFLWLDFCVCVVLLLMDSTVVNLETKRRPCRWPSFIFSLTGLTSDFLVSRYQTTDSYARLHVMLLVLLELCSPFLSLLSPQERWNKVRKDVHVHANLKGKKSKCFSSRRRAMSDTQTIQALISLQWPTHEQFWCNGSPIRLSRFLLSLRFSLMLFKLYRCCWDPTELC